EVTGRFANLDTAGLPAFFKASLAYSDTDVDLKLKARLGDVDGLTRNERSVGQAIDRVFNQGGDIPDDIATALFALSDEDFPGALVALSGDICASHQSVFSNLGLCSGKARLLRVRPSAPDLTGGSDRALAYGGVPAGSPTDSVFAPEP